MEAIARLAKTGDCVHLITYLERIMQENADVRKLTNLSPEQIIGRQVALNIIDDQVVSVLKRLKNGQTQEIKEEYE